MKKKQESRIKNWIFFASCILLFLSSSSFAINRQAGTELSYNSPIRMKWVTKVESDKLISRRPFQLASPVVVENVVYVGSAGGVFYALDTYTGKKLWKAELVSSIYSEPLVDGDYIYVADRKGIVFALAKATGKIEWQVDIGEEISSKPAVLGNTIYVTTVLRKIVALDIDGRGKKWQTTKTGVLPQMTIKGSASPVIYKDLIFAGYADGSLVCYSAKDGNALWEKQLGSKTAQFGDVDATPLIIDDVMYVPSADGKTYAMEPSTGKIIWSLDRGGVNDIVADGDNLFISGNAMLSLVDKATGKVYWDHKFAEFEISSVAVRSDGDLILFSTSDKMYVVDKVTGETKYKRFIGKGIFGKPVIHNDIVYALTNSSKVVALGKR